MDGGDRGSEDMDRAGSEESKDKYSTDTDI